MKSPALVEIGARSTPAEAVTQYVVEVSPAGKVPALVHLLKDAALESVLVFSRTKHGADRIGAQARAPPASDRDAAFEPHAGPAPAALKRFKSGDVRVLIATDIAARGIDVDGISHVINFDFPPQPEDYVHRIGRTGRAQAIGDAISFVTHEDADSLRRLERFLGRGITRKKLDGYVAAAPAATAVAGARRDRRPARTSRSASPAQGGVAAEGASLGIVRPEALWATSRPAARASRPHLKHCPATTVIHCLHKREALVVRAAYKGTCRIVRAAVVLDFCPQPVDLGGLRRRLVGGVA